jgi:hypothetical protein
MTSDMCILLVSTVTLLLMLQMLLKLAMMYQAIRPAHTGPLFVDVDLKQRLPPGHVPRAWDSEKPVPSEYTVTIQ